MKLAIQSFEGKATGDITLDKDVFGLLYGQRFRRIWAGERGETHERCMCEMLPQLEEVRARVLRSLVPKAYVYDVDGCQGHSPKKDGRSGAHV